MRVLILGATGPVGILLTRELIQKLSSEKPEKGSEHKIILFVRSPQKIPEDVIFSSFITVVNAQLSDIAKLEEVLEGVDAVLSALGPSVSKGPFHPSGEPLAKAYEGVLGAMRKRGVKRIFVLGTASNTAEEDKSDIRFAALVAGVATLARNAYKDVVAIGKTVSAAQDLDWTIVRVPILTDKNLRDFHAGYIGDGRTGTFLARVGFAVFIIGELFNPHPQWVQKKPMICSISN
ncbi:NAD-P-binding protein [Marasmius fiardii PR-910]|nr:NAD-P-binding protein [Marasmius fiardii PR-910]